MSKFFLKETETPNPWGEASVIGPERVDAGLFDDLRRGKLPGISDEDVAEDLLIFVIDDLTAFGTGGGEVMTNDEMRRAIGGLNAVMKRIGVQLETPFRDFNSFKAYWLRNDGYNSWQARREILDGIFNVPLAKVMAVRYRSLTATLVDPISPHAVTGWPRVDAEIEAMRTEFRDAVTPENCRAVGLHAVAVLDALSAVAYSHAIHGDGGAEPSVSTTKDRLDRVVLHGLPGSGNAEIRKLARSAIEAAQAVKHGTTPDRLKAGIAADAVLVVTHMMRRLADVETAN